MIAPPTSRVRLILARHGQTSSNVSHVLDTAVPGAGLTERGTAEAVALAKSLAGVHVDAVFASTLLRTQQTAAPLATALGLPVQIRDGIREIAAGDLEMRGDRGSVERYLATAFAWPAGNLALRMPGGESGAEMLERFDRVVAEAASGGARTVVIISHGGALRVWTAARADNVDADFAATHPLANTGIVVLDGDPVAGWHAASWEGDVVGAPGAGAAPGDRSRPAVPSADWTISG